MIGYPAPLRGEFEVVIMIAVNAADIVRDGDFSPIDEKDACHRLRSRGMALFTFPNRIYWMSGYSHLDVQRSRYPESWEKAGRKELKRNSNKHD